MEKDYIVCKVCGAKLPKCAVTKWDEEKVVFTCGRCDYSTLIYKKDLDGCMEDEEI